VSASKFKIQGVSIGFETLDPGSPGWNLDWSLKFGLDGSVSNAFDYGDADVDFLGVGIDTWYNFYFGKDKNRGLVLTFGLSLDRRRIVVDDEINGSTMRIFKDEEDLYKVYGNLSYRF
jgi:hypothetical protein